MFRTSPTTNGAGAGSSFEAVLDVLRASDLRIANLEMPLTRRGYQVPKAINLRADPERITDVRAMGFQAVTLANNHMMDFGPDGTLDTVAACRQAEIACCGAGSDLDAALRPAELTVGDVRVALFSVACTLPIESAALDGKPGIAPLRVNSSFEADVVGLAEQPGSMPRVHSWAIPADQDLVCQRIAAVRPTADVVIVGIHWGAPSFWLSGYQGLLAEYQQPLAHALVEAGADVIYGHHAHALHPVELYRGKPIFYRLGNFVFDLLFEFTEPESVIARVTAGERHAVELVPVVVDDRGYPRLAEGAEADRVLEKRTRRSEPFGTRIMVDNGRGYVTASE